MILDGHIHIMKGLVNSDGFCEKLKAAGVDGGVVISIAPASFKKNMQEPEFCSARKRLDNLFQWVGSELNLYPFFWIDPMEEDALGQVEIANSRNVKGFKIICNRFYPGDKKALEVYRAIAKTNKPILFHSGILWDGQPSSCYNRPAEFEALLDIGGLRFALAHVSWPWYEECIAVYGKFLHSYTHRPDTNVEMYIDLTPGTPPNYRFEVFSKLFSAGYDIYNNLLFGTDCNTNNYETEKAREWIERDNNIYGALGIEAGILQNIYSMNLLRFINGDELNKC